MAEGKEASGNDGATAVAAVTGAPSGPQATVSDAGQKAEGPGDQGARDHFCKVLCKTGVNEALERTDLLYHGKYATEPALNGTLSEEQVQQVFGQRLCQETVTGEAAGTDRKLFALKRMRLDSMWSFRLYVR